MKTIALLLVSLLGAFSLSAAELWLASDERIFALVEGSSDGEHLDVLLPDGERRSIPLADLIAVSFRGRGPVLIQTGAQEFRTVNGDLLRAQIDGVEGDRFLLDSHLIGEEAVDSSRFTGFVSLPIEGYVGRRAESLVDGAAPDGNPYLDWVLDRRASRYPGTIRRLSETEAVLDHEHLLQAVPLQVHYLAGVRMADATRMPLDEIEDNKRLRVRVIGRDGSELEGRLLDVSQGVWRIAPTWEPERTLDVDADEIRRVEVLGGRLQFLSRLPPESVDEQTHVAPPQPYRRDRSCQGEPLRIIGTSYLLGLGVHARSELRYRLDGRFSRFLADIGMQEGASGSVVFRVLGDGRELYAGEVMRADDAAESLAIDISGVDELTLQVEDAGDLDVGDSAVWGGARLLRAEEER